MDLLWDPLRKKNVAATPEERVRQWFLSLLRDSLGVPAHLMMSEVSLRFGDKPWRADILVYDRSLAPLAVVECKRPDVSIDASVAEQALRYNSVLGVRFIFLTNGKMTYLYKLKEGSFVPCDSMLPYEEMIKYANVNDNGTVSR